MAGLPPPPLQDPQGSFGWLEWYRQLRSYLSTASSIPWNIIQFGGSKLTDIAQRAHNDLQSVQGGTGGERYHLTSAQLVSVGTIVAVTAPVTKTADFTLATTENWVINNKTSACVVTLPTASSFTGRTVTFQNYTAFTLASNASNVVPLGGGAASTPILAGTVGKWATLVSNGTSWVVMQAA